MNIIVKDVSKSYNNTKVLRSISFNVESGSTFLYAGPNGAGKTTTMNIALGFIKPDTGFIHFNDKLIDDDMRKKVGVALEFETGYTELSVYQNFLFLSKVYNIPRPNIEIIIEKYKLSNIKYCKYGKLSKGMKRLTRLASIEFIDPDVIILDEPTEGLDIENITNMKNRIFDLKEKGKTIIICSHNLFFAWELADKMSFINNGKIIMTDYKKNLENKFNGKIIKLKYSKKIIEILERNQIKYLKDYKAVKVYVDSSKKGQEFKKNLAESYIISEENTSSEDIYRLIIGG